MGTLELQEIVDGAYAAALDGEQWAAWSWRLADALEGICATFAVVDREVGGVVHMVTQHRDPKAVERYIDERIDRFDPQISFTLSLTTPLLYRDTDYVDYDDPGAQEYFAWQDNYGRLRHHMSIVAPLAGGRTIAGVSIHSPIDTGPISGEGARFMAAAAPDVVRAMQLGFVHGEKLRNAYWRGAHAGTAEPALLLDHLGRLLSMTAGMEEIVRGGDGVVVFGERVRSLDPTSDNGLQRALADALRRHHPISRAVRIRRLSGRISYVVTVYPLPRGGPLPPPLDAAAMVTVVDPTSARPSRHDLHRQAFGFTPRESELAALLMADHSIESAAAALAISMPTARVHLRRLLEKAGVSRQIDLVRLLARIG